MALAQVRRRLNLAEARAGRGPVSDLRWMVAMRLMMAAPDIAYDRGLAIGETPTRPIVKVKPEPLRVPRSALSVWATEEPSGDPVRQRTTEWARSRLGARA